VKKRTKNLFRSVSFFFSLSFYFFIFLDNSKCDELFNSDLISTLEICDINQNDVELFSTTELDEILKSFPINREEDQNSDDLFVQMLLDNEQLTTFDDLFSTTSSLSLPKITSVDEFDAFLRDFSLNLSSYQQEISTPTS
jgi:hypothetical protein